MIKVYGRPDSSAVARVMWTLEELNLEHERVDWGGAFGGNDDADYRAMCPSGKIPAIRFENGESLWESNAIIRYLCAIDPEKRFVSEDPFQRAHLEAWMDWAGALQSAVSSIRKAYKPVSATAHEIAKAVEQSMPVLKILERRLSDRDFVMGAKISAADFALGVWGHRLWRCPEEVKPSTLPSTWAWLARLRERSAYQNQVVAKVSAGPQTVGGG